MWVELRNPATSDGKHATSPPLSLGRGMSSASLKIDRSVQPTASRRTSICGRPTFALNLRFINTGNFSYSGIGYVALKTVNFYSYAKSLKQSPESKMPHVRAERTGIVLTIPVFPSRTSRGPRAAVPEIRLR